MNTGELARTTPDLSVIIVTWNGREPVLACLGALFGRAGELSLELILVDNDSSDGTTEAVAREFPHVRRPKIAQKWRTKMSHSAVQ